MIDTRHIGRVLMAVTAVITVLVLGTLWLNSTTRIDASQHVSNLPCGPDQYPAVQTCPGDLVCATSEPRGPPIFTQERVGVTVEGARCVTPVFPERYCGLLQGGLDTFQIGTVGAIAVNACGHGYELEKLLQTGLDPRRLLNRIIDTDGRGAAWIHEQGLELLKDDPDASEIDITRYMNCSEPELAVTDVSYDDSGNLSVRIKNIQQHDFPDSSIITALDDGNTTLPVPPLGAGEAIRVDATITTEPSSIYLDRPYCGPREIGP